MAAALLVAAIAAVVTAGITPLVMRGVRAIGAVDVPSDPRKVHTEPVPTLGGVAMIIGFMVALGVAAALPAFREVFTATSEPIGLLIGVVLIGIVGIVDDLRGLPPTVKMAGQILASLGPVLFGLQLVYVWMPGLDVVTMGADLGLPLTVLLIVAMINAVNFVDGLDGLAAGVVLIGSVAFFSFTAIAGGLGSADVVPTAAPLIAAITAGVCAGFLVHNFHPAKIFMGDTGSMTLGLLLASAAIAYVGRSTVPTYADFAGAIPLLLIPVLVLAVPFIDTAFAIARRAYRRQPLSMADKGHLHHLLITFGHSHRRAVLVMYYWSAIIAGGVVALAAFEGTVVLVGGIVAVTVGIAVTVVGIRRAAVADPAEPRIEAEAG